MRALASALNVRFMYTNQIEGLMVSFTFRFQISEIHTEIQVMILGKTQQNNTVIRQEDETDSAKDTLQLAGGLLADFQKSTSLNTVISLVQYSLARLSSSPTTRLAALTILVDGLYARLSTIPIIWMPVI
ncbi:hypothetical protein CVT25_013173 [Psilocybe cyanescens]|uniref:Uncharacterized protein n=1 Tax=Psilocybe cyanescens TaxID=93625 RepID=A0A409XCK2_PSICY|nr:hypothetical protein CVT25_013173 [Psilocybe cyanescens]